MLQAAPPNPIDVRFFPDYRGTNPYQELLYRSLGPAVIAQPLDSAAQIGAGGQDAGSILHLHWETAAFTDGKQSAESFLDALSGFRDRGGRIVWTIHNLMPHDHRYRAVSKQVRSGILALADIVHLHSLPALTAAMEQHALPMAKVRIIPHGNFDGVYPSFSREQARSELQLEDARMIVLMPGQIRAYKAPGALIEAFLDVAGPDDRLILAGHRAPDVDDLTVPDDPRIVATFGFSMDRDLALVHAAADFAVLSYTASLTSGSAILAQTLGRGTLGSDTPGLRDAVLVPATGVLYDPAPEGALASALHAALNEGPDPWAVRGKAAAQAARARDWTAIGATWRSLFMELARLPRPAGVLTS
ncbi:MAG: peptidase M14 [Ruegeria sp.]|uniref:peptidase M14 n=1 Tax=Ruegeria sp. TaxID=1879320 RepID=UPI00349EB457